MSMGMAMAMAMDGLDPPECGIGVVARADDRLVEARLDAEGLGIRLEVLEELLPGRERGELGRELEMGELAELLGNVEP